MERGKNGLLRAAAVLAATGVLGACDGPTEAAGGKAAVPGGPSRLVTPACAGPGGQEHSYEYIDDVRTWTRANSPHRVSGITYVVQGGRLTIAPGAVVCFGPSDGIHTENGGRLIARGRDTARILMTARDPAIGWYGLDFSGPAAGASYVTNVVIENIGVSGVGVDAWDLAPVILDSVTIRQAGRGVELMSPNARLSRSRVDTTTNRILPAVVLGSGARFERTVVRGAAGVGVRVHGPNVLLQGGRIEGSNGVGLQVSYATSLGGSLKPVRVVGGRSYGVEMPLSILARLYPTPALQDSLLGNARDTIVITGGVLRAQVTAGPRIPLLITDSVAVDSGGTLFAQPGAKLVFREMAHAHFRNGGRLLSRGSAAKPVLFTADEPVRRWRGLWFYGTTASTSYVTNTRIEHGWYNAAAVTALESHRVIVDSSVIRWSGAGAALLSPNSRISRTRVDTMLAWSLPAVELGANARIESTRVRAPAGPGVYVRSAAVVVASCEVRDGEKAGIEMDVAVTVRNCNLVNNLGPGIVNWGSTSADVRGNWWGSTGGPTAPGGDGMYGLLVYNPWRTTPYVLPYVP